MAFNTNRDIPLDRKKFQIPGESLAGDPSPAVLAASSQGGELPSTIELKSTPGRAEITLDGKYVDKTPATLHPMPGDHSIKVEKTGFKP